MSGVGIGSQMGPDFRIEIDNHDITENFRSRLIRLVINDKLSLEVDTFTLVLDDSDGQIILPQRGSALSIAIGWHGEDLIEKGTFKIGGIHHSGSPDTLTLTGFSTELAGTLKEKRSTSYDGKNLGEIVQRIAEKNGLQPLLSKELAAIPVVHFDQTDETDLQFISRLAQRYDAIATIKYDRLMLIRPGKGATAQGESLERVTIRRREGDKHNFVYQGNVDYIGAKASWYHLDKATTFCVTMDAVFEPPGKVFETRGSGYLVLTTLFTSQEEAIQALEAEWRKSQRMSATLTFTLARGRPELIPEMLVNVEGFKDLIDKFTWVITNVDHTIDADGGLISNVTLELLLDVTLKMQV
ncbi:contractile injection system protein, VgrG/Pvc8 family [Erwinia sp. AnSW2-5]|uniref:contractile injection system protein, VgrG/Pvc8 family n=1 Tax=Erwinia sp. AnSW2-5 TaxID=3367692 RepID=UPI00385C4516